MKQTRLAAVSLVAGAALLAGTGLVASPGGQPSAPGVAGGSGGACCRPDGTCVEVFDQFECQFIEEGVYQGDGTSCNKSGFCGACCLPNLTCEDFRSQDSCEADGGTYAGDHPAVNCSNSGCPELTGPFVVSDVVQARIGQDNSATTGFTPMQDVNNGPLLEIQLDLTKASRVVIRLVGQLSLINTQGFAESLAAAIEVDGVVDEGGEVQVRSTGDPGEFKVDQVASELVVQLAPGMHTIRGVWRRSANANPTQANRMGLTATVYTSESCPTDLNADDTTGVNDLLQVLGAWGPCPE